MITVRLYCTYKFIDLTLLGFWTTYIWNQTEKEWTELIIQNYDASLYWNYIDWYATAIVLKQQLIIGKIGSYALEGLQDNLGDIVKVETIGL